MKKKYTHMNPEERAAIMLLRAEGASFAEIGRRLGRSRSSICREVGRNARADGKYDAHAAAVAYCSRRKACVRPRKLAEGMLLHGYVRDKLLCRKWSPQQISAKLRIMNPDNTAWQASHETIYAAIYAHPKGELRQGMAEALRQAKPKRGIRRRTAAGKGMSIPEEKRIIHRPEEVASRLLPGHWEGDFIKGAFNRSAVGTLVERKTRFVVLCRMESCTAASALESFVRQMGKLPAFLRQSLAYDRGSEMALHEDLARMLKLDVWFADPYSPWQRGSNENTNGLLRQFMPKGTDLSGISQERLNAFAQLLNSRPRQTLGWKTPEEALAEDIKAFSLSFSSFPWKTQAENLERERTFFTRKCCT
jgi:IS30 family transposase